MSLCVYSVRWYFLPPAGQAVGTAWFHQLKFLSERGWGWEDWEGGAGGGGRGPGRGRVSGLLQGYLAPR